MVSGGRGAEQEIDVARLHSQSGVGGGNGGGFKGEQEETLRAETHDRTTPLAQMLVRGSLSTLCLRKAPGKGLGPQQ